MGWKLENDYTVERLTIQIDFVQMQVNLAAAIEALRKSQGLDYIPKVKDPDAVDIYTPGSCSL